MRGDVQENVLSQRYAKEIGSRNFPDQETLGFKKSQKRRMRKKRVGNPDFFGEWAVTGKKKILAFWGGK